MRVYLDSSALLKRVVPEVESDALAAAVEEYVEAHSPLVSSSLAWVEVSRALRAQATGEPAIEVDAMVDSALSGVLEEPITMEVVALARRLTPPVLRTLDAIHLASALLLDADLLVAYDRRLTVAAAEHGLRTLSPG